MPTIPESSWALDTNILVYATAMDAPAEKQRIAQRLLEQLFLSPRGCMAVQVLSEYLNVVLHGVKTLFSEDAGSLKRPLGIQVVNPFAQQKAPQWMPF